MMEKSWTARSLHLVTVAKFTCCKIEHLNNISGDLIAYVFPICVQYMFILIIEWKFENKNNTVIQKKEKKKNNNQMIVVYFRILNWDELSYTFFSPLECQCFDSSIRLN